MILRISIGWFEPVNHLNFQGEYTKTHLKIKTNVEQKTETIDLQQIIFQQVCEVYNKQNDLAALLRFLTIILTYITGYYNSQQIPFKKPLWGP